MGDENEYLHSLEASKEGEPKQVKLPFEDFVELLKSTDIIKPGFKLERLNELPQIIESARAHAARLAYAKIVPCDICVANFVNDREKALELGGMISGEAMSFSADEMSREVLEEIYPDYDANPSEKDGRVRVHGITPDGKYQTYCHFCDDDMCLSQVNEGKNWDKIYEAQYRDTIAQLPERLNIALIPKKEWDEFTQDAKTDEDLP